MFERVGAGAQAAATPAIRHRERDADRPGSRIRRIPNASGLPDIKIDLGILFEFYKLQL